MAKSKKDKDKGEKKAKKDNKKEKKEKKVKKAAKAEKSKKTKDGKGAVAKGKTARPSASKAAAQPGKTTAAKPKSASPKSPAKAATTTKASSAARTAPKPKAAAEPKTAPKAASVAAKLPAIGSKAPQLWLTLDDGSTLSLDMLAGKNVVLYFYPKDDTPGCTVEAIDFTARLAGFEAANTIVIGVSKDSTESHCKFRSKHGLGIQLGTDESGRTLEAYGAWGEKNLYGRKYMGITRTTFLIDRHGIIAAVWPKVRVKGHADEVLEAAKALS